MPKPDKPLDTDDRTEILDDEVLNEVTGGRGSTKGGPFTPFVNRSSTSPESPTLPGTKSIWSPD